MLSNGHNNDKMDKILDEMVKSHNPKAVEESIQTFDPPTSSLGRSLTLAFASTSSRIPDWGTDWVTRDNMLREFWKNEPYLASAIFAIAATRAAFSWEIEGPPKSVEQVHRVLHDSEFGAGWINLKFKVAIDLLTQDNGAFVEVIRSSPRTGRKPQSAPVIGLAHLDASQCTRTGNPETPVIYQDAKGAYHSLKWYQVLTFEEMPSPEDDQNGRQICFVSRVLRAAEIVQEINRYKGEKISGRFARAIHLVGGVAQHELGDAKLIAQLNADNAGLTRYMEPIILASLDPNAKVSHEQIDLATLPDAFNEDETLKWYVTLIAMASGGDFQDFAPLPGGNLGTASQSETLHRKSKIKGNALWMKLWEHKLQFGKIIPPNVTFRFMQQDSIAEAEQVELAAKRASTRSEQIGSGEITFEVARQLAVDAGDLKQEHLLLMGETDVTPSIIAPDEGRVPETVVAINSDKRLSFGSAEKASWWVYRVIQESPIQAASPINMYKLKVFRESLRNQLTKECVLTTENGWQTLALTKAAYDAGIHPHALRLRLPDEYSIFVKANLVVDSKGQEIYKKVPQPTKQHKDTQVVSFSPCFLCGQPHYKSVYLPLKGWRSTCESHYNRGLLGKAEKIQYNIDELLLEFRKQVVDLSTTVRYNRRTLGLFISALAYAYSLGSNRETLNKSEINFLKKEVQKQNLITVNVDLLSLAILNSYYKGVTECITIPPT